VSTLAQLLGSLGDLSPEAPVPFSGNVYQGALVDAVKHFQRRHGLEEDGCLGPHTLKELNTPLNRRVAQLQLTLERWRWLPHKFTQPPVVVNIPEFRLRAGAISGIVVVGRAYRHKTPVFASEMKQVIFRPYWNVPLSIQRAEFVPSIEKDRSYLTQRGYEILDAREHVLSAGVVTDDILRQLRLGKLSIRQKPGSNNALGLVKFSFPNRYNVYLHATPMTALFSRARRDFSHGCIRVEDPVTLAAWVLRDKPEWTRDQILAAMNGDKTIVVDLDKPIPVLVLYGTAVVMEDGEVHFFEDIYGHDAELEQALARRGS
jgi:murein L,D-transpeptidase YcbB/YkuD